MGGNAFEDLEKLTPEQYEKYTKELMDLIGPMCLMMEPYIPLPEKEVHGDVDFLILFKEGFKLQNVIDLLKLSKEEYILNKNLTANIVYKKKQIDFNITASIEELERCRFYKSYGGIGAFLGLLLPSKLVKFNEEGLQCMAYHEHLKLEFTACNNVSSIMTFYGLSPEAYAQGFTTRKQVFNFILKSRFIDPASFKEKKPKWVTKLINSFMEFLTQNEEIINPAFEKVEDPIPMTLKYFGKENAFQIAFDKLKNDEKVRRERTNKWNGKHIIDIFGIPTKDTNNLKIKFEESFGNKEQFKNFIDNHTFEEILSHFSKVCEIEPKKE